MAIFAPGIFIAGRIASALGWLHLKFSRMRALVALCILCQVFPLAFLTMFWGWKKARGNGSSPLALLRVCAGLFVAVLVFSAAAALFQGRWDGRAFHGFALAAALTLIFSLSYQAVSTEWDAWSLAMSLVPAGSALFSAAAGYTLVRASAEVVPR
jgi:hypothetical protein